LEFPDTTDWSRMAAIHDTEGFPEFSVQGGFGQEPGKILEEKPFLHPAA